MALEKFTNGESLASVRAKLNLAIDKINEDGDTAGGGKWQGVYVDGPKLADTYWISGNEIWRTKQAFTSAAAPMAGANWESVFKFPDVPFPSDFITNVATPGIPINTNLKGLTYAQILAKEHQAIVPPTVTLSTSTGQQEYNQMNVAPSLTWDFSLLNPGATLANIKMERSRDNQNWSTVFNQATQPAEPYADGAQNTGAADNRNIFYKLTVTDTAGGVSTATAQVAFKAYVAPTAALALAAVTAGSNATARELGDTGTKITGTITRNSPNVALGSYQIQYQVNGSGSWINLGEAVSIPANAASHNIAEAVHSDAALVDSTSLGYRVQVVDGQQTTTSASQTVTFQYTAHVGYSTSTTLTVAQAVALANKTISNSKARTVTGVTAGAGQYTFIAYRAAAGDLAGIIQNGATPVLGAFTKLADITGTNTFGATVTLRVYRSNATQAFTNASLAIS